MIKQFIITGVFLALTACTVQHGFSKVMSVNDVEKIDFNNPEMVLLDVRTPEEYEEGHIHDAVNMDYYSDEFKEEISELDKDKIYFVYCTKGNRSTETVRMLKRFGFKKVVNLKDGYSVFEGNNEQFSEYDESA